MTSDDGALAKARWRSFAVLVGVSVLFHYPRWFLILDECAAWLGTKPWANDFAATCRWDCSYFVGQSEGLSAARAAFFPLFPLVIRGLRALAPFLTPSGSAVVASNLFSIFAIMALVTLGSSLWPKVDAPFTWAGRPWAAWILGLGVAIFPFSQFSSFGYSEPLFMLLLAGAAWALTKSRWRTAALAAGLAAATRPQGIWVAAIVGALYAWEHRPARAGSAGASTCSARELASMFALLALPLGMYMIWNQAVCGDFLYFIKIQGQWGRHFDFLGGLKNQLPRYELNWVLFALSLAAAYRFARRTESHWRLLGWSSLLMAEIPLFVGGFAFSYSRFMAANLGLFALLAEILAAHAWLLVTALFWALPWLNLEIVRWLRLTPYNGIGP